MSSPARPVKDCHGLKVDLKWIRVDPEGNHGRHEGKPDILLVLDVSISPVRARKVSFLTTKVLEQNPCAVWVWFSALCLGDIINTQQKCGRCFLKGRDSH